MNDNEESLLENTLFVLHISKKTPKDVLWVGLDDKYETWEEFAERDFTYNVYDWDEGICEGLIIMGDGWYLKRTSDNEWGTTYWDFVEIPNKPELHKPFCAKYERDEEDEDLRRNEEECKTIISTIEKDYPKMFDFEKLIVANIKTKIHNAEKKEGEN